MPKALAFEPTRICKAVLAVVALTMAALPPAQAVGVNGQGTWQTTLLGRDLDGNFANGYEAYFDIDLDITWLADANYAKASGYDEDGFLDFYTARSWVANLNVNGITGWRLPDVNPRDGSTYFVVYYTYPQRYFATRLTTDDTSDVGYNITSTKSELAHLYNVTLGNKGFFDASGNQQTGWGLTNTGPFKNILANRFWLNEDECRCNFFRPVQVDYAWNFSVAEGVQHHLGGTRMSWGAWAVHAGDVGVGTFTLARGSIYSNKGDVDSRNPVALVEGGGTFNTSAGYLTFSGGVLGSGGLIKSGGNILTFKGEVGYSGNTSVQDGTLMFQQFGQMAITLATSGIDIASGASVIFSGAYTVDAPITGQGQLIKEGLGTLTLTGANTYSGGTTVRGGELLIARGASLGSGGLVLQSATFSNAGDVIASNAVTLLDSGGTFNTSGGYLTFNGGVSGSGGLTKAGSHILTFNGDATYTGATVIQGGTLKFHNNGQAVANLGTASIAVASGANVLFSGAHAVSAAITGLGSLIKEGAGKLTLSGANTYSGGTRVNGGELAIASSANLGTGGLTLQGGAFTNTGDVITGNAVTLLGAGGTFNTSGGYLTFNAGVSGGGGLIKSGSNTLTFNGSASYSGATAIQAGTLKFQNSGQASANVGTASIAIASGARMIFTGSHTVSAPITGAGQLVHEYGGTTTLTGDATHTGGTSIIGGQLRVGNGGTTGSLLGTVNTNTGTLAFDRSDNTAFNGTIRGTGGVIKAGAGQLALNGTHTYTGATTVEAGELKLNGSIAGSAITVQAGARLSGNAQVGDLTVAGDVNPGNSPGLLSAGNTTFMGGGQYVWELQDADGAAGVGYDSLNVNGALTLGGGSAPFVVALRSLALDGSAGDVAGFNVAIDQRFTLVSTTGGILNYSPASIALSLAGFSNDLRGGKWTIEQAGTSLDLVYTAAVTSVPEPEGLALMLAGLAAVVVARQRRS
jgi:fibronectin-binding autotransporter adhesin